MSGDDDEAAATANEEMNGLVGGGKEVKPFCLLSYTLK